VNGTTREKIRAQDGEIFPDKRAKKFSLGGAFAVVEQHSSETANRFMRIFGAAREQH
jgi:hypothetical protein